MSLYKLVDSEALDNGLTSIANAIRIKGGTSASLSYPAGFVSAIENIPRGGEAEDKLIMRTVTSYTNSYLSKVGVAAFFNCLSLS